MGCSYNKNRRCNYASAEELRTIINSLIERKKILEKDIYGHCLNNECNEIKNIEKKSIKDLKTIIDKLVIDVNELETKANISDNQNNNDLNILINFITSSGIYQINVNKETKLRDAFEVALFNNKFKGERYTKNMGSETQFYNTDYKTTFFYKEKYKYEEMKFLFSGDNISEKFRKNQPVSSLGNDLVSPISILVILPVATQIMLKTYYDNQ
jgi:hypothetical protein